MKKLILVAGFFATVAALPVFAGTACDEVKAGIAKKLDGKGVKNYSLEAVAAADVKGQKVVGVCEAGAKKVVYVRGGAKAAAAPEAKAESKDAKAESKEAKPARKHKGKHKAEAKVEAKPAAKPEAKMEAKPAAPAAPNHAVEAAPAAAPVMKGPVMTKPGAARQQ